jgi:hypothetical protein
MGEIGRCQKLLGRTMCGFAERAEVNPFGFVREASLERWRQRSRIRPNEVIGGAIPCQFAGSQSQQQGVGALALDPKLRFLRHPPRRRSLGRRDQHQVT